MNIEKQIRICPKCRTENKWHKEYYPPDKGYPSYIVGLCRGLSRSVCCEKCAYNFDTGKVDWELLKRALNFKKLIT